MMLGVGATEDPLVGEGKEQFLKQEALKRREMSWGSCGHWTGDSDLLLALVR